MTRKELMERLDDIDYRICWIESNSKCSWQTYLLYREIGHSRSNHQLNTFQAEVKAVNKLTYIFNQTITKFLEQ